MSKDIHSDHISRNKEPPKRAVHMVNAQSHTIIMFLCCLIPLLLIVALSSLGIIGSWGFLALILLCPILHLFLMRAIYREKRERKVDDYESEKD